VGLAATLHAKSRAAIVVVAATAMAKARSATRGVVNCRLTPSAVLEAFLKTVGAPA
jgi:hypothetical protein